MSYATSADLQRQTGSTWYIQLTDDAGTGSADEAIVAEALSAAQAEVNSYLARRYATPIDVSDEADSAALLRSITLDLAEYRLHARRPPVASEVASKRATALAWLIRIADGKALLPTAGELPASSVQGPVVGISSSAREWVRDEIADL